MGDRPEGRPFTPPPMPRPEGPPTAGVAQNSRPTPRPVRKRDSVRVPPQPIRKKRMDRDPVVVPQPDPEPASPSLSSRPVEPPPAPVSEETPIETPKPEQPVSEAQPAAKKPVEPSSAPPKQTLPASEPKPVEAAPAAAKQEIARPEVKSKPAIKTKAGPVKRAKASSGQAEGARPAMFSFALGGIVTVLVLCVVCAGGIGWFAFQSETGTALVASLGLTEAEPTEEPAENLPDEAEIAAETQPNTSAFESPLSPLSTPTLPATNTPTLLPPTATSIPTDTATPAPVAPTDTPVPTDTPLPTDTPVPTETPTVEPTEEISPTEEPQVPSEPEFKYGAPLLLGPDDGFKFIGNSEILFRWQSVDLAADEQYAVRVRYKFNNEITYQGAQVKEPQWPMPLSLYQQIDPPERRYEWFVVVERLNADGSGTAISPQSEVRTFFWD